jgi:hypothetical protein
VRKLFIRLKNRGHKNSVTSKKWNNKVWSDIKLTIEESTMSLISRIKEGMIQSVVTENDDW